MTTHKLLALILFSLLAACSTGRHSVSPQGDELSESILIIEKDPDGQIRHGWHRAAQFDLSPYAHVIGNSPQRGCIVLTSRRPRDCDQEQIDCFQDCMKSRLPSYQNHIKRSDGSKQRLCQNKCLDEYMDCLELQKSHALQFTAAEDAVAWLKQNREGLFVGTIVIVAGVTFVTLSAGVGAVILVPLVLLAD